MAEYEIVHWEVDDKQFMHEFDRLGKGIDYKLSRELTFLMETTFEETQRIVHQPPRISPSGYINTGSLRASGRVETSTNRRRTRLGRFDFGHEWEGTIEYGGDSPGSVHELVDYAGYELGRENTHDFMAPVDDVEPAIERAILDWYGG